MVRMKWHLPKSSEGIQESNWPKICNLLIHKWQPILKTHLLRIQSLIHKKNSKADLEKWLVEPGTKWTWTPVSQNASETLKRLGYHHNCLQSLQLEGASDGVNAKGQLEATGIQVGTEWRWKLGGEPGSYSKKMVKTTSTVGSDSNFKYVHSGRLKYRERTQLVGSPLGQNWWVRLT